MGSANAEVRIAKFSQFDIPNSSFDIGPVPLSQLKPCIISQAMPCAVPKVRSSYRPSSSSIASVLNMNWTISMILVRLGPFRLLPNRES